MIVRRDRKPLPIEQAFALMSMEGSCSAGRTVEAGIRQAAVNDVSSVEPWVSIGECLNRIMAAGTMH